MDIVPLGVSGVAESSILLFCWVFFLMNDSCLTFADFVTECCCDWTVCSSCSNKGLFYFSVAK